MQLIYRSPALYRLTNLLLYGRHYGTRFRVIADLIPPQATVVDLCCGPALLYHRYLKHKSIRYVGLDFSSRFIEALIRGGGRGQVWDLRSNAPLPRADYLVIQGSLYFFLPDPSSLIDRMLAAAKKQVIVAEAIRNFSSSRVPLVSQVSMKLAGAVEGNHAPRFTEETADEFFEHYSSRIQRSFKIPGGRDKVYVLEGAYTSAVIH